MVAAIIGLVVAFGSLRYPYQAGVLSFPHDEGAHYSDTARSEWWYLNMRLETDEQDSFGLMLTFFRKPASALIFNITDMSADTFLSAVDILGRLQADTGHLSLSYAGLTGTTFDTLRWTYPDDGQAFSYLARAFSRNTATACSLRVQSLSYPFAIDSIGYIALGDSSEMSYYYAMPFMYVEGSLVSGRDTVSVTGTAWFDRQWGPFGVSPSGGYEWFSITAQSADGNIVAAQVWNLFEGDTVPPDSTHRHINIFVQTPDTTLQVFTSDFTLERLGYYHDPITNLYFSQGWRVIYHHDNDIVLFEMHPWLENQIVTFVTDRFYEGITWLSHASAKIDGIDYINGLDGGYGFAELVQKFSSPTTPPSRPSFAEFSLSNDTLTLSWHPSQAGSYPLGGYRVYLFTDMGTPEQIDSIYETTDTSISIKVNLCDTLGFFISAFDQAPAINGSELSGPFIYTPQSVNEFADAPISRKSLRILSGYGVAEFSISHPGNWEMEVFSVSGRSIKRVSGSGDATFALSLKPGVYLATLKSRNLSERRKFVVIR